MMVVLSVMVQLFCGGQNNQRQGRDLAFKELETEHLNTAEMNILQPRLIRLTMSYVTFCLSGVGMTVPSFIEMYVSLLRLGLEQGD